MKKYIPFAIIFILISFHFCSNYVFLKQGVDYTGVDVDLHLLHKAEFHNILDKILSSGLSIKEKIYHFVGLLSRIKIWPPMVYFVSYLIANVFGKSTFVTELSNIFYIGILIIGTYFLGKKIGGKKTGLLAAFIMSSFPIVSIYSRRYGLDLPLMSWVPWLIVSLIDTEGFRDIKKSISFGAFLGIVILFKYQITIFILGPLIYILCATLNSQDIFFLLPKPKQIINLVFSLCLAFFISSIWWHKNLYNIFSSFIPLFGIIGVSYPISTSSSFSLKGCFFYISALKLGFFYLTLLVLAVFISFLEKENKHFRNILLLAIFVPYLILSLMLSRQAHWIFPILPAVALFISLEVNRLPFQKIKRCLIILILIFGINELINSSLLNQEYRLAEISIDYNREAVDLITLMKKIKPTGNIKLGFISTDLRERGRTGAFVYHKTILTRIYNYNIILNDPEINIVYTDEFFDKVKDLVASCDFIILQQGSVKKILEFAWVMQALEKGRLSQKQVCSMFDFNKFRIEKKIAFLKNNNYEIKEALDYVKTLKHSESYFFGPRTRLYFIHQIKKRRMTVNRCAQLLELPASELILWIDDYNQKGIAGIVSRYMNDIPSSCVFTKYYEEEQEKKIRPLLEHFTIIETRDLLYQSNVRVILLGKK